MLSDFQDKLTEALDAVNDEADRRIGAAFVKRFGEILPEDIVENGERKQHPDRDEYFYKGEKFITVYRPVSEWNEDRDKLSLSVTFIEH